MKLSIITINLNNKDGLQNTIDSVVSQTFKDFEWIVLDGGSTDGCKELIEKYADKFSYWVSEPDKGIYNAMNKGIRHAHGEYCLFLNSGDYFVDGEVLDKVFAVDFDEDVVYGCVGNMCDGFVKRKDSPKEVTLHTLVKSTILHSGNSFIRRDAFDKWGLYDENLKIVSDWKWFLKTIGLGGATTRYIDVLTSVFDISGISSTQETLLDEERKLVFDELIEPGVMKFVFQYEELLLSKYTYEVQIRNSMAYKIGSFILKPIKFLKSFVR